MSWTVNVTCSHCYGTDWEVHDGQWTCVCGKVMTSTEIAKWHATLPKPER